LCINKNSTIQKKAIKILIDNFVQREFFMKEIVKIELIISDEDIELYQKYREHHNRIEKITENLEQDDISYLLSQNQDKEKYRSRLRDATVIIK
jgi:hypothetical protein